MKFIKFNDWLNKINEETREERARRELEAERREDIFMQHMDQEEERRGRAKAAGFSGIPKTDKEAEEYIKFLQSNPHEDSPSEKFEADVFDNVEKKTFSEWLVENHPEMLDEAALDWLANNRTLRSTIAAAGMMGIGAGMAGKTYGANETKPKAVASASQSEEDEDINDEIKDMLRTAEQVPMKTTTQKVNGQDVTVSKGSAKMAGGKVVAPTTGQMQSRISHGVKKAADQAPRKFDATRQMPKLPAGRTASPNFGGAVE
jgi:hypothetical protein